MNSQVKTSLKVLSLALCLGGYLSNFSRAETVSLYDDSFTVSNLPAGAVGGILSGRWGTWDAATSTFLQGVTSSLNAGYVDLSVSPRELSITMNQTLNLGQTSGSISGVYAPGTPLAMAIFTNGSSDAQALNWSSATFGVVLTDASWITPTFANNANMVDFEFTSATIAAFGTFSFNSGNEQIGLALIPEPTSLALSLSALLLFALKGRRRSA